jgi:hypothetical protein
MAANGRLLAANKSPSLISHTKELLVAALPDSTLFAVTLNVTANSILLAATSKSIR